MKLKGLKNTDNLNKLVALIQDQRCLKKETIFFLKLKDGTEFYEHKPDDPDMEDDESSETVAYLIRENSGSTEISYTGKSSGFLGSQKSPKIFIGNATNETFVIKLQYKSVNKVSLR